MPRWRKPPKGVLRRAISSAMRRIDGGWSAEPIFRDEIINKALMTIATGEGSCFQQLVRNIGGGSLKSGSCESRERRSIPQQRELKNATGEWDDLVVFKVLKRELQKTGSGRPFGGCVLVTVRIPPSAYNQISAVPQLPAPLPASLPRWLAGKRHPRRDALWSSLGQHTGRAGHGYSLPISRLGVW